MLRISRIFILILIVYGSNCLLYCSEQHEQTDFNKVVQNDSLNKSIPSDGMLKASLKQAGWDIAESIINKDIPNLLKYFSEDIYLNWGGDPVRPSIETMSDLLDTTSAEYCAIFKISCCPYDIKRSIRDYLLEADSLNLTINIKIYVDTNLYHDYYPRGEINYDWDNKPEFLWLSEFPKPRFIYYRGGWKFSSFFTE